MIGARSFFWKKGSGQAHVTSYPVFRSQTSLSYASRQTMFVGPPVGLADNDMMIGTVFVGAGNATPLSPTPPAGWAELGTPTHVIDGSDFNGMLHIFWKIALSESEDDITFDLGGFQPCQAIVKAYSSCSGIGAASTNTGFTNSASLPDISTGISITTTAPRSLLLWESHDWEATGAISPPSGMTERFDSLIYCADQQIASAGATGNRTQNNGNFIDGEPWAVRMVELLAA